MHLTYWNRSQLFMAAAAAGAMMCLTAPNLAEADPMAPLAPACDGYEFQSTIQISADRNTTFSIPASGTSVGPGRPFFAVIGQTEAVFGNATGGITGRTIDFTVNWDGGNISHFTGQVTGNGDGASGTYYDPGKSGAPGPWSTTDNFDCITAPASAPKAPIPGSAGPPGGLGTVPGAGPVAPPPPVRCPPGGPNLQVPAGQTCPPPADAVRVAFARGPFQWTVNVTNLAGIGGSCTYDASSNTGLTGASKSFDIAANGTASFQVPAPLLFTTYHVVTSCTGSYDGKQVEFGHDEQDVP